MPTTVTVPLSAAVIIAPSKTSTPVLLALLPVPPPVPVTKTLPPEEVMVEFALRT